MSFDYYIIKKLVISFKYENKIYNIEEILNRYGMIYEEMLEYEYADSDDEYYYMKYLKTRKNEMERFHYNRNIYEDNNFSSWKLESKYYNIIKELIKKYFDTINFDDIILLKVEKNQYTSKT